MRWRGTVGLCLAAAVALGCPGGKGAPRESPRPVAARPDAWNVLFITIDTLRADHMGVYGYERTTSPRMDAFAREAAVFRRAYTYWPKTRGSFVAIMTGRRSSQTGYGKSHQFLVDVNPTVASVLKKAGYRTMAIVDNPNVAAALGYSKGFDTYRETWEEEAALPTEVDRARAISDGAIAELGKARPGEAPFFLWLHYVNPHAPYKPPPPFDKAFDDEAARRGPKIPAVEGFHGGVKRDWAVPGQDRLGYYVSQYDGEIAFTDQEVGRVLDGLGRSAVADRTVVVLTSDHGESLGEHDYYFDHGEDVFDPCLRVPLIVRVPGGPKGVASDALASTLDLVPTILDAVQVSYPPDLAGVSLLPNVRGEGGLERRELVAQNDRNLSAVRDRRFKIVATPEGQGAKLALYDLEGDPGETRDVSRKRPDDLRIYTRQLELFQERVDKEWLRTRPIIEGRPEPKRLSDDACERLRVLGYVTAGCP